MNLKIEGWLAFTQKYAPDGEKIQGGGCGLRSGMFPDKILIDREASIEDGSTLDIEVAKIGQTTMREVETRVTYEVSIYDGMFYQLVKKEMKAA